MDRLTGGTVIRVLVNRGVRREKIFYQSWIMSDKFFCKSRSASGKHFLQTTVYFKKKVFYESRGTLRKGFLQITGYVKKKFYYESRGMSGKFF